MTYDQLKAELRPNPTVVLFYGSACAPCDRLKPKLRAVCEREGVALETYNSVMELPAIRELGLRSVPAVVVVSNGAATLAFTGDLPEEQIRAKLIQANWMKD